MTEAAPFHQLAGRTGPPGEAVFVRSADGVRLRIVLWRPDPPAGSTVLLFPGRTEYAEKYGPVARDLTAAGHAVLAIDWRGQGASDRLIADPRIGHIADFADYQRDVAAMMAAARRFGLPHPWHLLAHSMGGGIGLRALATGLPVASAAFSAPMWGLAFAPVPPFVAGAVAAVAQAIFGLLHLGARQVPGRSSVLDVAFSVNRLTTDLDEYLRLMREAAAWPELAIGPPSFAWALAALAECAALARLPSPRLPALISLSQHEPFVAAGAIRRRARRWPGAELLELAGARHEALFEAPPIRRRFLDAALTLFAAS